MTDKQRNSKGQFVAGNSARLGKKKRILETMDGLNVFQIARNACPEMIETLYKIALNPREKALVRVTAANSILDRGLGKAVSHTVIRADMEAQEVKEVDITKLSEEKLMLMISQLEKKAINPDVIEADFVEAETLDISPVSVDKSEKEH